VKNVKSNAKITKRIKEFTQRSQRISKDIKD